ncbi:acyl carrier protein [Listeria aquatica]|uniref:acyl carrier protein n=1 Tax=Listeria aquatica TaxID=1494960 RepID=UPI003F713C88
MSENSIKEIEKIIKEKIIIERLEIDDIEPEEIANDMPLFDESGLGLDSVEALDVIAGIGEEFNINTSDLTQDEVVQHLESINTIIKFVLEN